MHEACETHAQTVENLKNAELSGKGLGGNREPAPKNFPIDWEVLGNKKVSFLLMEHRPQYCKT